MSELPSGEVLTIATQSLLHGIPRDRDYFNLDHEGPLADGWSTVGELKMFTATAACNNLGLFAKAYSTRAIPYAEKTIQAMITLRETRLAKPVLPMLYSQVDSSGAAILFALGD